ncbi:hypothetical protein [Kineococcus glutinatus]|uniref:Uncharacterized protein n=1 Tax=Kineococcus glutinatus TaxID=1070872 RepID=A0ABP9HQ81_9ACTN
MSEPVGVDFGSVDALPLPLELDVLLQSLRPARRVHTPSRPDSLAQLYHRHEREQVQQTVGFALPRLSVLVDAGQVELVATAGRGELSAPAELGRWENASVTVLYVVDEAVLHLPGGRKHAPGVTTMDVLYGHGWPSQPAEAPRTTRSSASGDATTVLVHGAQVGVQHREHRLTRLAWRQRLGQVECGVVVHSPLKPLQAVQMLVQCDVLAGSA